MIDPLRCAELSLAGSPVTSVEALVALAELLRGR
jgi:hypothetical protein